MVPFLCPLVWPISASSMIRSEVLLAVALLPLLLAIIAGDCCSGLPFVVSTIESPFVPSVVPVAMIDSTAAVVPLLVVLPLLRLLFTITPLGHLDTLSLRFLARLPFRLLTFNLLPRFLLTPFAFLFVPSACFLDGLLKPFVLHATLLFGQSDRFLFQLAQAFLLLQDTLTLGLLFGLDTLALQFGQPLGFFAC
uniref:Uncharacterized protein n=1 Tax=Anopheles maculatus TaxID=74869 RepID=A0A182T4C9_9DIPT